MNDYAETWTDIGRLPLRRRDRAAMALALECLRASDEPPHVALGRAANVLDAPGYDGRARSQVWNALCAAQQGGLPGDWLTVQRFLRARLALLLRVLLRVDAGEQVEWVAQCAVCHEVRGAGCWAPRSCWCGPYRMARRIRPLWEAAR